MGYHVTWKLEAQPSEWKHRGLRRPKKARQVRLRKAI